MLTEINLSPSELSVELINKLKALTNGMENVEITIKVSSLKKSARLNADAQSESNKRIEKAVKEVKARKGLVSFSFDEF